MAPSPPRLCHVHIGRLIAFNFFSEMAYRAPSLLHEYAHFIGHTMFPAALLPIISTLRAMVYTTIGLILMSACQLVFMHSLHWTVILLPFLAFLMGLTWFLSALGAFARDTSHLMMTITPLLMLRHAGVLSTRDSVADDAIGDVWQHIGWLRRTCAGFCRVWPSAQRDNASA